MSRATFITIFSTDYRRRGIACGRALCLAGWLVSLQLTGTGWAGPPPATDVVAVEQTPHIQPDYQNLIIPPNIAPLNFSVQEAGTSFYVILHAKAGRPVEIQTRGHKIMIPEAAWHHLVDLNKGGEMLMDIYTRTEGNRWTRYAPLTNQIAAEEIDPVLIYRKIQPVNNTWSSMGLYQRDLHTFEETAILENRRFAGDCCHCHALRNNNPNTATVAIRSKHYENSLLVISNGVVEAIRGNVGIVAWHPAGRLVAGSFSKPHLMFHTARNEMRDIAELEGWIGYFWLGSNVVQRVPGLGDETRLLAFPAWSPDGRHLYYCSSPNPWTNMAKLTATSHTTAKYDLMRIAYDLDKDHWGKPEMVLPAGESGFSVAQPRISPDGHWLFFCAISYGCWPTYDSESDLYGIDLRAAASTGKFTARKLTLNSDQSESLLSWSANSRWVVFSSKRTSLLFSRPYLAYVAADGTCGKPFILPQRDPEYYDGLLRTYTLPTLSIGPVTVPQSRLLEAIKHSSQSSLVMPAAKAQPKGDF
jgi:hypothetical protein